MYLHRPCVRFMGQQPEKGWRRAVARATGPGSGLGLACASPACITHSDLHKRLHETKTTICIFPAAMNPVCLANDQKQTKKPHPNPKPSSLQYFLSVKIFFLLARRNHCKRHSVHAPIAQHTVSKIAHCRSVSILHLIHLFPGCCWSEKCKVHTQEAQLFLQEPSQLRESNPGKGHELGLHVQRASQPQFILINVLSAAVKLDKII